MAATDEHLIHSSSTGESAVFFHKIEGDYYHYLADFKVGNERKELLISHLKLMTYEVVMTRQVIGENILCQLQQLANCASAVSVTSDLHGTSDDRYRGRRASQPMGYNTNEENSLLLMLELLLLVLEG